ncbi:SpoIIIAH-like family protein [Bacillus luteolus]|uniref:SpoIIIAH-like family protein n=1 Tax=Litchfieldia luteola TaxID=682179 RepID=A0ABR9QPM8_9BACI|nr:SpoIIIAH-like family protein [Cytobacillus luteolus]MBE4910453.1 SpoIIIAH-like family protein [Cytobacillus luteolus]MBP1941971.1 stage III sporulation protein AH [Cytobacillus luteolus]
MLLKKQTVWLLTMLSLVVVLSVYYITSPEGAPEDFAFEQEGVNETAENTDVTTTAEGEEGMEVTIEEAEDGTAISTISSDELFAQLRMDIEDKRAELREQLTAVVASSEVSAEEKNMAMEKMQELTEIAIKESTIETLIKSKGYADALVRADGGKVRITVKAKEHNNAAANDILLLVASELGELQDVAVTFEPAE